MVNWDHEQYRAAVSSHVNHDEGSSSAPSCSTQLFLTQPKKRLLKGPYLHFSLKTLNNFNKTRAQSEETVLSSAIGDICIKNTKYFRHVEIAQLIESDQTSTTDFFTIAVFTTSIWPKCKRSKDGYFF